MSFYNMLYGKNSLSDILLQCLDLDINKIPRFRDCYINDGKIIVYTRTGGGNRDFYESEKIHRKSHQDYYPEDEFKPHQYNTYLQSNPNYIEDKDDDFDCTYAIFYFKFPEEFKTELSKIGESPSPEKRWEVFQEILKSNEGKK